MFYRLLCSIAGLVIGLYSVIELNKFAFIVMEKDDVEFCEECYKNN